MSPETIEFKGSYVDFSRCNMFDRGIVVSPSNSNFRGFLKKPLLCHEYTQTSTWHKFVFMLSVGTAIPQKFEVEIAKYRTPPFDLNEIKVFRFEGDKILVSARVRRADEIRHELPPQMAMPPDGHFVFWHKDGTVICSALAIDTGSEFQLFHVQMGPEFDYDPTTKGIRRLQAPQAKCSHYENLTPQMCDLGFLHAHFPALY